jgi:DNA-binding NtrC family response regulator
MGISEVHVGDLVLLVEDEALIRMMLACEFEDAGYVVVEAGSADEAVALLSSSLKIAAVVTDIRMPGTIDGLGLVKWLNANRPRMPVVVTSGYAEPAEVGEANSCLLAVIPKPYRPADVVAAISNGGWHRTEHPDRDEDGSF